MHIHTFQLLTLNAIFPTKGDFFLLIRMILPFLVFIIILFILHHSDLLFVTLKSRQIFLSINNPVNFTVIRIYIKRIELRLQITYTPDKSLMYVTKNNGPNKEPCGTTEVT